jgi:low affinity Fe/Cu permease
VAFLSAFALVATWALSGPLFGFSDTWQLVANTATTVITILMVFLIQSTQDRDARSMNLKLDELLRAIEGARTSLIDLENLNEAELDRLEKQFHRMRERLERTGRDGSTAVEPVEAGGKTSPVPRNRGKS